MNTNHTPRLWLAGWHYRLTDHDNGGYHYPGKPTGEPAATRHPPDTWHQAASWLHHQLHTGTQHWNHTPLHTHHRLNRAHLELGPFPNPATFIDWALHHRRGRGIWGRDQHRCYYLISADNPTEHEQQLLTPDTTHPLTTQK